MKLFVVTEGKYSDYHIEGIFSSEELATKYIENKKQIDDNEDWEPEIEEWELDALQDLVVRDVYKATIYTESGDLEDSGVSKVLLEENSKGKVVYANFTRIGAISTLCLQHAIKLAAEARQEYLRNREAQNG